MLDHFPFYLALIIAMVLLIMLANRIRVAYPVLLVVAGLLLSVLPGIPKITVDPSTIFVIFLPPLLYEAAWSISWKELWRWRRIIGSFAFVVVFLTAWSVAFVASRWIPGFTLALGFLLGGIVSPPDAVSAGAILRFVKVPKRMSSILEGESLLNDASSLIIFRFAIIAIGTGQFVWYQAAASFSWMIAGGVLIGLLVAWLVIKAHRYLPTDANMDMILDIVAPYLMYIAAEEAHSSGVLAVVCGGLLLSNKRHSFLSSSSRIREVNVWQSLVFLLNGLVFMLIGLALPGITAGLAKEGISISAAIGYGLLVTGVLVLVRILSAYGAVITTLIMRNFITVADARNPGFRVPLLLGWTGMRGVVSLAAALSIPVQLDDGTLFPQRNIILFITFIVILCTLLVQGLTLPYLLRKMPFPDNDDYLPEVDANYRIKKELARRALEHLNEQYASHVEHHPMLQQMADKWEEKSREETDPAIPHEAILIYLDVLDQQRQWLLKRNNIESHYDEDIIRKHLYQLDIEEEKWKTICGMER